MNSAVATSRDHSEILFATPAIVADRRADGSIILKSTMPLRECTRCVGDWLEHWARQTPDRIFLGDRAAIDDRLEHRHLQGRVATGTRRRCLDSGAGAERRTSAGDPVGQQRRSCAVRARRPARRRALGGDLAGLFADVAGFRQAQEHGHAAWARRDLCFRHKAVRGGALGDQAAAFGCDRQRRRR